MAAAGEYSPEILLELRELKEKDALGRERHKKMVQEINYLRDNFVPSPFAEAEQRAKEEIEGIEPAKRFDRFALMHGSRPRDAALLRMVKYQDRLPEDMRYIKVKMEDKKYKVVPLDILFGEEKRFIATDTSVRDALLRRVIAKNDERGDILGDMGISPYQYIEQYMQPPLSMRYQGRLGDLEEKIAMNIARGKKIRAKIDNARDRLYDPFL